MNIKLSQKKLPVLAPKEWVKNETISDHRPSWGVFTFQKGLFFVFFPNKSRGVLLGGGGVEKVFSPPVIGPDN